jgi:hypothetical protein
MVHIDKNLITDDIKTEYMVFYKTVFDTIFETYRYSYYLKGISEVFTDTKCRGIRFEVFIKDIISCLKQKICLNVWKLILDNGKDALTIYKMRDFIARKFGKVIVVDVKNIAIDKYQSGNIIGLRSSSISHNLYNKEDYEIYINELMQLMDKIINFFKGLWIDELIDDSYKVGDTYFTDFADYYKNSVKDVLNNKFDK